jgi:anti-sigma factor (TIGR02949 family)
MPNTVPDINCLTAIRQLWDFLDQELTEDRMDMVRRHLEQCQRCLPHHDFARRFLDALHATRDGRLMPPELRSRVMALLVEAGYAE